MLKTLEKLTDAYFAPIGSYFLAAIFIYAGIDKALHFSGFQNALASYVVLPLQAGSYLAIPIILAELWVGLGFLIKRWRKPAAFIAVVMLAFFTIALVINSIYNPNAICGCWFTITLGENNFIHIIFNLLMLGIAYLITVEGLLLNKQILAADKEL